MSLPYFLRVTLRDLVYWKFEFMRQGQRGRNRPKKERPLLARDREIRDRVKIFRIFCSQHILIVKTDEFTGTKIFQKFDRKNCQKGSLTISVLSQ